MGRGREEVCLLSIMVIGVKTAGCVVVWLSVLLHWACIIIQ
jgi:hypothetical protein